MRIGWRLLGLLGLACLVVPAGGCNFLSTKHWSCVPAGKGGGEFTLRYGSSSADVFVGSDTDGTFSINPLFDDMRHALGDTATLHYLAVTVHNVSKDKLYLLDVLTVGPDRHKTVDTFVMADQYIDDLVAKNNGYPDSTPAESALSEGWQARPPGSEQTMTAYGGEVKEIDYVTPNGFPGGAQSLYFNFDGSGSPVTCPLS